MLVYDLEIIKAIPDKKCANRTGIKYCKGWDDHENMGISVIGVYDYTERRYRVFCEDNFDEFRELIGRTSCFTSFNGISFDNKILAANGIIIPEEQCYDLLVEVWKGDGLSDSFRYPSHLGYGLGAICKANFGTDKTGEGALAPVLWQEGNIGQVIDYCLQDVKLTMELYTRIQIDGKIMSPKEAGRVINVRRLGE